MSYSIGEFARMTDLSIYTLRFYEEEKLINPARKANGHRSYTDDDMVWIQFIKRLKETGMSIRSIQIYAALRAEGSTTMSARMAMLVKHRKALEEKIDKLQEHLENLNTKIDYYQTEINKEERG